METKIYNGKLKGVRTVYAPSDIFFTTPLGKEYFFKGGSVTLYEKKFLMIGVGDRVYFTLKPIKGRFIIDQIVGVKKTIPSRISAVKRAAKSKIVIG